MATSIIDPITGASANVETGTRAARVILRSHDVTGSYRLAQTSGTIAAALSAASLVYGFRFAPALSTSLALVRRVRVSLGDLVGFTAGFIAINGFVARPYTALDATGGTAGTVSGNNGKLRTSHAVIDGVTTSISTTAAISGGTSTLDTAAFGTLSSSVAATAGAPLDVNGYDLFYAAPGEHPLVLANLEGFNLKATVPATGTWQLGVEVQWDVVTSY